jgi:general secretion pathway protein D
MHIGKYIISALIAAQGLPAAMISGQPPSSTVSPGQNFTIDVRIDNVTDLYAFQFDLMFNPAVLAALDVMEGAPFNSIGVAFSPGFIDDTIGMISFIADTLSGPGPGVSTDGTLAHISFNAIGLGSSPINLGNIVLLGSSLNDIASTVANGSVNVTSGPSEVPEPGAYVLFLIGLAFLGGIRWMVPFSSQVPPDTSPWRNDGCERAQ